MLPAVGSALALLQRTLMLPTGKAMADAVDVAGTQETINSTINAQPDLTAATSVSAFVEHGTNGQVGLSCGL